MNELQAPAQTVPARLFHGWIVVGGAFAALFIAFGIAYSFAAFFPSLQAEFSATRGDTSLVFAISAFLFFSLGALSGPLADRGDGRKVVAAGMVMIVVGLGLAALAESLWQVYLAYGLGVGLGVGFVYVPSLGAVQHWFRARRGMASGIAVAGIGCGTLAVPMAATAVIDQWDWRAAYGGLAVIALVFGIAVTRLLENDPAMRGLTVDGIVAADDKPAAAQTPAWKKPLAQTVLTRPFLLLYISGFVSSFATLVPFAHLAAYATDNGIEQDRAVLLVGLVGLGSILGRFAIGGAADRLGRRASLTLMYGGSALAMGAWPQLTEYWELVAFALVFGVFYGGIVALVPALTADYFHGPRISGISGVLYTKISVGALGGAWLTGLAFDFMGSYTLPILAAAGLSALAAIMVSAMPRPG